MKNNLILLKLKVNEWISDQNIAVLIALILL